MGESKKNSHHSTYSVYLWVMWFYKESTHPITCSAASPLYSTTLNWLEYKYKYTFNNPYTPIIQLLHKCIYIHKQKYTSSPLYSTTLNWLEYKYKYTFKNS